MSSLKERIELLERDLSSEPMRISVYRDLPFAIFRYDPEDEWVIRRDAKLLATRLEDVPKRVVFISIAELLWEAIDGTEGMDAVVELERTRGFEEAEEQVNKYLSDEDWMPLAQLVCDRLSSLDPKRDVAFLVRAPAMAPSIYHMSKLLDEMQGRSEVPAILFYPGTMEGTTGLRFMGLKEREALGNYRVKIYG
jgi:Domain of unknown function (DUF1788)